MPKPHPFHAELDVLRDRILALMKTNSNTPEYRVTIRGLAFDVISHPLWRYTIQVDARLVGGSIAEQKRDAREIDLNIAMWAQELRAGTLSNADSNEFERELQAAQVEMRSVIGQSVHVVRVARMAKAGVLPPAMSDVFLLWEDVTDF